MSETPAFLGVERSAVLAPREALEPGLHQYFPFELVLKEGEPGKKQYYFLKYRECHLMYHQILLNHLKNFEFRNPSSASISGVGS